MSTGPDAGPTSTRAPDEVLLGFTTALRAAGVAVTADRSRAYLEAVALVGLGDRAGTRAAGRATLCASPDDLAVHDRVFEAWFDPGLRAPTPSRRGAQHPPGLSVLPDTETGGAGDGEGDDDPVRAAASATEVLRHRDVATLDAAERLRLAALLGRLDVRLPVRPTRRRTPHRRGSLDASRTLRASLRRMGEPAALHRRRPGVRTRRVVLLVDVSGSMAPYADALLRLAHRMVTGVRGRGAAGGIEVFTVGTRLTRITDALRIRDPERALVAAGEAVPDWSGGTRLGETLQAFVERWGRRGLARGAVVVVLSDGWERGGTALLGEQVARLRRLAHRVVWVNPHRGKMGYAPLQGGIVAVLPHLDSFVAGHSLATFAELVEVIADA
ncbi:VWA domain-containing protein [Nocardioides sp. zg-536]|uniref:VWA domain-containing protein n=1 Tax=Nocardioides faecalis TaxID=2803858 RepID=A0A939BSA3_9ACTN|nr:VWA domain-containing protein [Nocardioides faecalis]MBM9459429.1 VWA domain-containing protein [Nocardioides faecalis]QVI59464.1 VWA domain-containing protein [Nocardioides faecalis]